MAIALDVIIAVILVFTVWRAGRKGFIRTVFDMLKFVISVICAIVFKNGLAEIIIKSSLYDKACEKLQNELSEAITNAGTNISSEEMLAAFRNENPDIVRIVESMGADLDKTRMAVESAALSGSENLAKTAASHILEPAMESVAHILAFALVFVAAFILLWIAENILDTIFCLPVLKGINRFSGVAIGIVCAVLYVSLFVSVTSPIMKNPDVFGGSWSSEITSKTFLYSYVEQHNILSIFIK